MPRNGAGAASRAPRKPKPIADLPLPGDEVPRDEAQRPVVSATHEAMADPEIGPKMATQHQRFWDERRVQVSPVDIPATTDHVEDVLEELLDQDLLADFGDSELLGLLDGVRKSLDSRGIYGPAGQLNKSEPFELDKPQSITSGAIRRVTSSTGGSKEEKLARFDQIPTYPLNALAEHYGAGNAKYPTPPGEKDNWRKGYPWSLSYAALQRHANAFWSGEDIDAETGHSHLTAVAWHAFTLLEWTRHPGLAVFDDRQNQP